MLLEEDLRGRGLKLPAGNLVISKEKDKITIHRSLALLEKGLSVAYDRIYPSQYGFDEMMRRMERALMKAYVYEPDETFVAVSDVFKNYLVRNLGFTEIATFSRDTSSETWIQGRVKFASNLKGGIPEEHAEYSIGLSDAFTEEISKAFQKRNGRGLSSRRQNILAKKEEPLVIDNFLRAVDIQPARSKDENYKAYRNLRKSASFLVGITFKDYM